MWTSFRSREAGNARDLYAKVMGYTKFHRISNGVSIHIWGANSEAPRADPRDIRRGGDFSSVHDSSVVCLCDEFSDPEVSAGAEQDNGDGVDISGGTCGALVVELAGDVEGGVEVGGRGGGAEHVVVVNGGGSAAIYIQWDVWDSMVWVFVEGVSRSMGICSVISFICSNALVIN